MKYDYYNREERSLCAHLFRLLHDIIPPVLDGKYFIDFLVKSDFQKPLSNPKSIGLYCEVALIRDAYYIRKPNTDGFMNQLVDYTATLFEINNYRSFNELPDILKNPLKTHPKQIRMKAKQEEIILSENEVKIYGFVQAMFNAKPDLVITFDNTLIVYEAKFTQRFDTTQIGRTADIASVWRELLFEDLGFDKSPELLVSTIGPECFDSQVSWEWIFELSKEIYQVEDRSYLAFKNAVDFISNEIAN